METSWYVVPQLIFVRCRQRNKHCVRWEMGKLAVSSSTQRWKQIRDLDYNARVWCGCAGSLRENQMTYCKLVWWYRDSRIHSWEPNLPRRPVSRRGRQLFLTVAGSLRMNVFKGDAKTAFLQGSVGDQELHCEPIAELAQALGLEHRQCVRLRKSVYGLIDAPRAWWERVETDMNKLKWRTLTTEPCFWVMPSVTGRIEGLVVAYVGDFMVAIHEESPVGQRHFSDVKALYEWGEWESGSFTQCGVQIVQHRHQNRWAGFSLSCAHYAESMVLLDLSSARRKQRDDPVTAKELAGLRGLLGQLMWLATQVVHNFKLLCHCSWDIWEWLLFQHSWKQTNLQDVHWFGLKLLFAPLFMKKWVLLVGQMPVGHIDEKDRLKEDTSLVWPTTHSWNKRKVLSVWLAGTVASWPEWHEVPILQSCKQQLTLMENSATFAFPWENSSEKQFHFNVGKRQLLRSQVHWCWMHLHEVNQLVWDWRTRGSGLETLSLKRSLVETRCGLRWTHSAAQLADCTTKGSEEAQKPFKLLKRRGWKWRLVYDPSFTEGTWRSGQSALFAYRGRVFNTPAVTAQRGMWKLPCFVMCLHGLDILSMWMWFFSLLCATASAFQHSHLAKDVDVFVTNCMNNPRSCSAGVDEMRVLQLFVFFVPTMFSGILGSFGKNSTVLSPFWSACKHSWGVCVVERIVARSVLSPEFSTFSASACEASFFSNPCLQGWVFFSCTWEHESRVFEPVLRCCVTRAWKQLGQASAWRHHHWLSLPLSLKDLDPLILLSWKAPTWNHHHNNTCWQHRYGCAAWAVSAGTSRETLHFELREENRRSHCGRSTSQEIDCWRREEFGGGANRRDTFSRTRCRKHGRVICESGGWGQGDHRAPWHDSNSWVKHHCSKVRNAISTVVCFDRVESSNFAPAGMRLVGCKEVLFQPSFTDKEASGIHVTTSQNITKWDADTHTSWYANVVLWGGHDHAATDLSTQEEGTQLRWTSRSLFHQSKNVSSMTCRIHLVFPQHIPERRKQRIGIRRRHRKCFWTDRAKIFHFCATVLQGDSDVARLAAHFVPECHAAAVHLICFPNAWLQDLSATTVLCTTRGICCHVMIVLSSSLCSGGEVAGWLQVTLDWPPEGACWALLVIT